LLRDLDVPLADIREILARQAAGETFVSTLQRHRSDLERRLKRTRVALRTLDRWIAQERNATSQTASGTIERKQLEPLVIASIRVRGHYRDSGPASGRIGRKLGRNLAGPAFLLHHDREFKDGDGDFEACMPLRQVRTSMASRCATSRVVRQSVCCTTGPTSRWAAPMRD
jgi:hypothetical protein